MREAQKKINDLSLDERVGLSQIQEIDRIGQIGGKTKEDNTGKNH